MFQVRSEAVRTFNEMSHCLDVIRAKSTIRMVVPRLMILGLSLFLTAGAHAAGPSFSCAKAQSAAEKAICGNPGLAALDVKIAEEFRTLHAALDPQSAAALAQDQRWFVGVRDRIAETPKNMSPPEMSVVLKDRAKFLGAIDAHPPEGFAGTWRNVAGGFDIKVRADGAFSIEGNAAQPVNGNWVCDYQGSGKATGSLLEPKTEEVDENSKLVASDANASRLSLTREGATLKVKTIVAPGDGANPFCGMNGFFDGAYFLVPAGYDKFPGSF